MTGLSEQELGELLRSKSQDHWGEAVAEIYLRVSAGEMQHWQAFDTAIQRRVLRQVIEQDRP